MLDKYQNIELSFKRFSENVKEVKEICWENV